MLAKRGAEKSIADIPLSRALIQTAGNRNRAVRDCAIVAPEGSLATSIEGGRGETKAFCQLVRASNRLRTINKGSTPVAKARREHKTSVGRNASVNVSAKDVVRALGR